MIDISLGKNEILYRDFEKSIEFLSAINESDFQYPAETIPFHVYSEIKTDKELMAVKSFLATQNLEHTKLILWSDYDIRNNSLIQPYKNAIDMRVYEPYEESRGTPLEGKSAYLSASDEKYYMQSGVLRFLLLYKYGGIWADMDMVFLRDFKPIIDQDFAYMWGSSMDFAKEHPDSGDCFGPCAALMGAIKGGDHINLCMQELLKTEIRPCTTCFDEDMLAKVYRKRKFTVFPSAFFDTEWQIGIVSVPLNQGIQAGWFSKNEYSNRYLFEQAFAWHWHNTSRKMEPIEKGSKFHIFQSKIDEKLRNKGFEL